MFAKLLIGHLISDYFIQTDHQAMNKVKNDFTGWAACIKHSFCYSIIISMIMFAKIPIICIILTGLLISSFVYKKNISLNSLVKLNEYIYLFSIGGLLGMSYGFAYNNGMNYLIPLLIFITHFPIDKWSLAKYFLKVKGIDITRTDPVYWIVYVVSDNTLHLVLMMAGLHYLFGIKF